ncbi:tyrosinase cofactor [Streptomyces sp. NBC_01275]|uniref:tyrosinase family oxidase copper chaperone n=1 Tax=Streptomyces sp. NBC_01275 TaxID=2903807 RepID=UPI002259F0FE|nr:tyrosinase family oxidase copper chaperone [Streptomyces sp. NBC_01275]MCX4762246.1 tyrosinase cofactor [Streptomyces sp. NBC_01275]
MAVSVDAVPATAASVTMNPASTVGARPVGAGRLGPDPSPRRTRRDLLRGLLGAAAAAFTIAPVVAASPPPGPQDAAADTRVDKADEFDEVYRGRHLRGVLAPPEHAPTDRAPAGPRWQVTVDGRPLHLMRRADGTWLSMVDHYRSYDTPLAAARAAVDELGPGEKLRDTGSTGSSHPHDGTHMGGRHGLHA